MLHVLATKTALAPLDFREDSSEIHFHKDMVLRWQASTAKACSHEENPNETFRGGGQRVGENFCRCLMISRCSISTYSVLGRCEWSVQALARQRPPYESMFQSKVVDRRQEPQGAPGIHCFLPCCRSRTCANVSQSGRGWEDPAHGRFEFELIYKVTPNGEQCHPWLSAGKSGQTVF